MLVIEESALLFRSKRVMILYEQAIVGMRGSRSVSEEPGPFERVRVREWSGESSMRQRVRGRSSSRPQQTHPWKVQIVKAVVKFDPR